MKTVLRIFGVLIVLLAFLFIGLSIWRTGTDKDDLRENEIEMTLAKAQLETLKKEAASMTGESKKLMDEQIATADAAIKEIPSESILTVIQVLFAVMFVVALAAAIFLFRPNLKFSQILLIGSVVLLLVTYFISPDIERGEYSGMNNTTLALMSGIPVIFAGLFAFLVARKSAVKA
ncbi:MAG: hypothetical protein EOO50_16855 [Flavobacterium sp.]|uniref:hypothetical protein n=1 Tax=Flavobacterium sp. TaxID=239 RepID=UPI00121BD907|nr:hypothetical protein [Flavobacterium sp.]RZJ63379.1 MAG: hypothetical protein EOO50_16855 [Flavobacterium sp.]